VIIGNPPYNANQLNENENNKNRKYPAIDKRIKETYIVASAATRDHGDSAALQFEVELTALDQLDQFGNRGVGSSKETGTWMHAFSEILRSPPGVEILRFDDTQAS